MIRNMLHTHKHTHKCQDLARKKYDSGQSGGIKTGDAGSLERCIGSRDSVFGEDMCFRAGTQMGKSDW